jgi:hypothetical protein
MSYSPKRDWTQYDIVEETQRRHTGLGFFNVLHQVVEEAFGGTLVDDLGTTWQFPMGDITVGALIDFLGRPTLRWHNESGGPTAYVSIEDYDLAERFRSHFRVDWLSSREEQDRSEEDTLRAGGWPP